MKLVVCAKEVLDPDAVNSYALAGRLAIGADGRTLTQTAIPRLINGYDEQAIEAALRIRDAGAPAAIHVVSVGRELSNLLRHASALGADEVAEIALDAPDPDGHVIARILAAYVRSIGGADLVLCGRQASDDDQGVVPALIGEALGMPVVTVARSIELDRDSDPPTARIVRVTPDGDQTVEVRGPAVVTISNELGAPRYPTAARKLAARRVKPRVLTPAELGLAEADLVPALTLIRRFVPELQGKCEFIEGASPAELADRLIARLRQDGVLS